MEIVIIILFSISFYLLGKYIERLKWNKLIYEGKIPKPNQLK